MHPFLRIILKISALIFFIFVGIQSYNLMCTTTSICRPFFLDFYLSNIKNQKIDNFFIISNFMLINNNKNVEVTIDFDKKKSALNELVKVNLVYKNLTNNKIVVKNNFEQELAIIKNLTKMIKCPCSSKIKLNPRENKIVTMEFYYFYPTNKKILDQLESELNKRSDLLKTQDLNIYDEKNQDRLANSKLIITYFTNNITLNFE